MKFGIQLGIGNKILVGNINKKGNMFLQKENKTIEVLQAVIDLIQSNKKNNMTTELVSSDTRYILSLDIKDK
jgi:hypothetical protein